MDTSINPDGAIRNAKKERSHDRCGVGAVLLCGAVLLLSMNLAGVAHADPCEVPNVGGTVILPPAGCDYLSPDEVHMIIDGLPPGTTIELAPIHKDFICGNPTGGPIACSVSLPGGGTCEGPGGGLGGNADCFASTLELELRGTGALAGFTRTLSLPANTEIHTGPRTPGDPVQTFNTEMVSLEAVLTADVDFGLLQIQAGSSLGLPSPGQTTLTQQSSGNWKVESFFDIQYQIDFQGAPSGALAGLSGSTNATIRMEAGTNPCAVVDNGSGTVSLPPAGCEYLSPEEVHEIINGLPAGVTVELDAIHKGFICEQISSCSVAISPGTCEVPGGTLGGGVDCFQSLAEITVSGTGSLAGLTHSLIVPLETEVHTGPRIPGDPVQDFPTKMFYLQGQIANDPLFATLSIQAGDSLGLSSPGRTKLTRKPNGNWEVDSFFDIAFRIDFSGSAGGPLEGLGGSSTGTLRMETGNPLAPVQAPSITGIWLWLLGALVLVSSILAIRHWGYAMEA